MIAPAEPNLAFFQQVKPGDLRKQEARSNNSPTGGGARDLRMPVRFWDAVAPFFPTVVSTRERSGLIHSETGGGVVRVNISFWRPTDARPGEIRIGKITEIEAWNIQLAELEQETSENYDFFYLLTLDSNARVWARTMSTRHLSSNRKDFADYVRQRIAAGERTTRGVFSFAGAQHFPS